MTMTMTMTKGVVYNQAGEKVSEMDLNPKIFGVEKIDPHLIQFAVRVQQANRRQAIAHTKNRGEVSGGGKKPWRQKGTGRARAGSIRSPLWRGGGITFGPRSERNYSLKINRTQFRKALFTVLSDKLKENRLVLIDNLETSAKTREMALRLQKIVEKSGLGKKYAVVLDHPRKELERAVRNLTNVKVLMANRLNIFDLLKFDLLITKNSVPIIEQTYLKG